MPSLRVLRVYHAGRDPGHRRRERALVAAGVSLGLVVPAGWPDAGSEDVLTAEDFPVWEVPVKRAGDVNRHSYSDLEALRRVVDSYRPDLIDIHEEPVSVVGRQLLRSAGDVPTVMYTAQNVDKRFPPPFAQYETAALSRTRGLYPCSAQAASVARGKGFGGVIEVLPLGYDASAYRPGEQRVDDPVLTLGIFGRLVPEKGVCDAVRVLAAVRAVREAELLVVGRGPEEAAGRALAASLGVAEHVRWEPWLPLDAVAERYRQTHVVLIPSVATETWVEQFGRVIVEGQASGAVVAGYASGAIGEVAGDAGVLVGEGDVDALSRAVVALITDGSWARRRSLGLSSCAGRTWDAVAAGQVAFYERVLADVSARPRLPAARASAAARAAARGEFGPPAVLRGGVERPFALPVLRRDSAVTRVLGRVVDVVARQ